MAKICISSEENHLDSNIASKFGRCRCFIIVDCDTSDYKVISNPGTEETCGAGIKAAQLVISEGVSAVLTGNIGSHAREVLEAAGIRVHTGISGKVKDAIEMYKSGNL